MAALEAAQEVDPVAARIGAANTLVRQQDGSLKAYNTDWSAAIEAVEEGLGGSSFHHARFTLLLLFFMCCVASNLIGHC